MTGEGVTVVKMRDVLMVTMPPDPDDSVVGVMQEQILDAMDRYQARGLVLDISAVETMDSYFARMVAETAHMVSLMGGRTVIAGMRPSVAVTSTQLGLSLGRATTALDVDRALDRLAEDGSMIKKR